MGKVKETERIEKFKEEVRKRSKSELFKLASKKSDLGLYFEKIGSLLGLYFVKKWVSIGSLFFVCGSLFKSGDTARVYLSLSEAP